MIRISLIRTNEIFCGALPVFFGPGKAVAELKMVVVCLGNRVALIHMLIALLGGCRRTDTED